GEGDPRLEAGRHRRVDGGERLADVREGLAEQEIDAAVGEQRRELRVLGPGLGRGEVGSAAVRERPEAPGDAMPRRHGLPRETYGAAGERLPVVADRAAAGPEGVRRVHLRSGARVLPVDRTDEVRVAPAGLRAPAGARQRHATPPEL